MLSRQSTPHFSTMVLKSQLPTAHTCLCMLYFASSLCCGVNQFSRQGNVSTNETLEMVGTDPSEYVHAASDAFGLLRFCRSTPARLSPCCSPPWPHTVSLSTVVWHTNVVTAGCKATFLFASRFSAYKSCTQCLRSASGEDRDLLLCGCHIYRQGFVGGKAVLKKMQVSWTCGMCFARAQEYLPPGQQGPGISGRNISCDPPVVTISEYLLPQHRWLVC